jgi:hypothetical protein
MAATHVVYDPPLSNLPFLAVIFQPDGTLHVKPFKSGRAADAYAARLLRQAAKSQSVQAVMRQDGHTAAPLAIAFK